MNVDINNPFGHDTFLGFLNNLNIGVVTHAADTTILQSNKKAHEILGLSEAQMLGKEAIDPQWKFFKEDGSVLPLEEYPVARVISSQQELKNKVFRVYRPQHKDNVWTLVSGYPVFDKKGKLIQAIINFIDITDLKRSEEENNKIQEDLLSEKKLSEAAVNAMNDTFFVFNSNTGEALRWNKAFRETCGYSDSDIANMKAPESWYSKEDLQKTRDSISEISATGQASVEISLITKSGEKIPFEYNVSIVDKGKGSSPIFVSIGRDVRERNKERVERERLLKLTTQNNEDLKRLIFVASHDFRTPIVNIDGMTSEVTSDVVDFISKIKSFDDIQEIKKLVNAFDVESIDRGVTVINAAVKELESYLSGLLKLSRVGFSNINKKSIDVGVLLNEIVEPIKEEFKNHPVEVIIENLPHCCSDELLIRTIFRNLISNAFKYSCSINKPQVIVSGHIDNDKIHYYVKDNGVGIAERDRDKVFEFFYRINDDTDISGTGIGLALVKWACTRLSGNITFKSTIGEGSTFSFNIPLT